jgi:pimeloyl-ACP methyl ester carboxylesterase
VPDEADPSYARWKDAIAGHIAALDDGAFLVGHSIGGSILINALAEDPPARRLGGVFLDATPFIGPGGWPGAEIGEGGDLGRRLPPETPIFLYHGSLDHTAPPAHADLYAHAIPGATVRRLPRRDHQLDNDLTEVAGDIRELDASQP